MPLPQARQAVGDAAVVADRVGCGRGDCAQAFAERKGFGGVPEVVLLVLQRGVQTRLASKPDNGHRQIRTGNFGCQPVLLC